MKRRGLLLIDVQSLTHSTYTYSFDKSPSYSSLLFEDVLLLAASYVKVSSCFSWSSWIYHCSSRKSCHAANLSQDFRLLPFALYCFVSVYSISVLKVFFSRSKSVIQRWSVYLMWHCAFVGYFNRLFARWQQRLCHRMPRPVVHPTSNTEANLLHFWSVFVLQLYFMHLVNMCL